MAEGKLAGTKILMVIAPEQFRDEELLEPRAIFSEQGAEVVVASTRPGLSKGMLGASCMPDVLLKDVDSARFDAVVVVGGMGSPTHLWDCAELHELLKQMDKDDKIVSAICLSGAVLAKAGVLRERQATVWPMPESLAALEQGKARYLKLPVVCDGRTVTANGPEAASEFGLAVVRELARKLSKV
jgi:protease I